MKMYIAFRLSSFLFFILAIIFVGTRHHCCCPHCLNVVHTERNTLIYTSSFHDHLTVQFITADLSIAVHLQQSEHKCSSISNYIDTHYHIESQSLGDWKPNTHTTRRSQKCNDCTIHLQSIRCSVICSALSRTEPKVARLVEIKVKICAALRQRAPPYKCMINSKDIKLALIARIITVVSMQRGKGKRGVMNARAPKQTMQRHFIH